MSEALEMWVVYEKPKDFPSGFIARKWLNDRPTQETVSGSALDCVRERLPNGLFRIERAPSDDTVIIETWI